jgi:lysophospholipase L1-like esterase
MFDAVKARAWNIAVTFLAISLPLGAAAQSLSASDGPRLVPGEATTGYNIVFVGDSITAGATIPDSTTQATPVRCVERLRKHFHLTVQMSNQGHSGHTTVDWLPSNNPSSDFQLAIAAAGALQSNQPGQLIFSIMLGVNDSAERGPNGAPVSPADYSGNLHSIVDQLLVCCPDALVFVHYPTWYSTNTQNSSLYGSAGLARLKSYFPELNRLIADCAVAHPGRVFAGDKRAFDHFSKSYASELTAESGGQGTFYLHPNSAGAVVLGQFWADAIVAALPFRNNRPSAVRPQNPDGISDTREPACLKPQPDHR